MMPAVSRPRTNNTQRVVVINVPPTHQQLSTQLVERPILKSQSTTPFASPLFWLSVRQSLSLPSLRPRQTVRMGGDCGKGADRCGGLLNCNSVHLRVVSRPCTLDPRVCSRSVRAP